MTSLQQAAAQGKTLKTTKKGAFESSFASGLDLSEFEHSATTTLILRTSSAAAELLQIKALEAQQAAREEEKEVKLLRLAKTKGQELTAASTNNVAQHVPAPHKSSSAPTSVMDHANMSATLVHLHGEDINGAHHKAKLGTSVKKSMRRRKEKQSNGTKRGAMKKSRRSKY